MDIKTPADIFNQNAALYQQKYMDVSLYYDVLDMFCNSLPKEDAEVLEIACGPGNITKYLLSKCPGLHILGTDIAPNMIELAKANNPSAVFQLMDCRDINSLGKKYDAVMCGFVLPYLDMNATKQLFADVAALLKRGGVFYISTMEGEYSSSRLYSASTGDQVFMYYYEGEELSMLLQKNGFSITNISRKIYQDAENKSTIDVVIQAVKIL
jgi:2-polyprenyl-3-methyl-5-hydroxy-6-metoxy-1,4-benzoquinol methylase